MAELKPRKQELIRRPFFHAMSFVCLAWLFVTGAFIWPTADSTRPPYFDLNSTFSQSAYWLSETGGSKGAGFVAILMLALFVSRPGIAMRKRVAESLTILGAVALFGGLGSALNEYVIKEYFQRPRPNVVSLMGSQQNAIQFYQQSSDDRSNTLRELLAKQAMSGRIKQHWIRTTGYSFPSGHSFASMFFATLFLLLGLSHVATPRRTVFYAIVPWAILVCYSRTVLRVHTPTDIAVGALQGIVLGVIAFFIAQYCFGRLANIETGSEEMCSEQVIDEPPA